jgi:hypothetical protein
VLSQVSVPTGEQSGITETHTATHLIRVGQSSYEVISMRGEQIGVTLSNVPLPFVSAFHFTMQIWAEE